mmetsp:Transcript_14664/g.12484  ORF Transcript_14664/g.12484 Transcript_14664/m.12484 type:complete len:303 (-) Transcript_14664:210-1118(-)
MNLFKADREYDPTKRHANYSEIANETYNANRVKIEDDKTKRNTTREVYDVRKRIHDYLWGLDDDAIEKQGLKEFCNELILWLGRENNYSLEDAQRIVREEIRFVGFDDIEFDEVQVDTEINFGEDEEKDPLEGHFTYVVLSEKAKNDIYKLFKEGWSVRDLSVRYGIVPERVNFIVWSNEYFYKDVLPNIDLTTWRLMNEHHYLMRGDDPETDYGIDLHELTERKTGIFMTSFNTAEADSRADDRKHKREIPNKLDESWDRERFREKNYLIETLCKTKKRKFDIITEKFVGHGESGYHIKTW